MLLIIAFCLYLCSYASSFSNDIDGGRKYNILPAICMFDLLKNNELSVTYSDNIKLSNYKYNECGDLNTYNDRSSYVEITSDKYDNWDVIVDDEVEPKVTIKKMNFGGNRWIPKYGVYEFWNSDVFHKISFLHIKDIGFGLYHDEVITSSTAYNKILNKNTTVHIDFTINSDNMIIAIKLLFANQESKNLVIDLDALFTL
jgi:hypothetical protein